MTDMRREAFEQHHGLRYDEIERLKDEIERLKISDALKMHFKLDWERTFETWKAAMRYRDEQEKTP